MVDPISLGLTVAGGFAGAANQSKYVDAYRNQRKRVGAYLQHGERLYGMRADDALAAYRQAIGRLEEGTQAALSETSGLGRTGMADLQANLQQQLSRNRSGMGGVLSQSSLAPAFNRGAYSDYRRDLGALNESLSARRASIQLGGAANEANATQALARALFQRGQAEFDMNQALAGRFGNVAPPQGVDFGGLAELFKGFGGFGGGGSSAGSGIPEGITL